MDWLGLTIDLPAGRIAELLGQVMGFEGLAAFEALPHGARGYRSLWKGPEGVWLYADPPGRSDCHLELRGKALECMTTDQVRDLVRLVQPDLRAVTRLDGAFDGVKFVPADVVEAIQSAELRTLAKRETFTWRSGVRGVEIVYLGSISSQRCLRVYLKGNPDRLYTRCEFVCKGDRADAVMRDLLDLEPKDWGGRMMSHLRDFVDFWRPWWGDFIHGVVRAGLVLAKLGQRTYEGMVAWVRRQVGPALAVILEREGGDLGSILTIAAEGRERWRPRHVLMAGVVA